MKHRGRRRFHTNGDRSVSIHCYAVTNMGAGAPVKTAEAIRELVESARNLRDLAQQCYLLIGLTDDPRLKAHLLDLGLELEQRIGLIERGSARVRGRA
jgi:hypothetical protein